MAGTMSNRGCPVKGLGGLPPARRSGPTWSVIDAGGMTAFPVLDHVGRLTIMVDNDVSETGQRAAAACRDRWAAAGKAVRCAMPEHPGQDFNDVLLEYTITSSDISNGSVSLRDQITSADYEFEVFIVNI